MAVGLLEARAPSVQAVAGEEEAVQAGPLREEAADLAGEGRHVLRVAEHRHEDLGLVGRDPLQPLLHLVAAEHEAAESRPAGFEIQSIAVDAADPDVVYAATENRGVLRSTDGGRTWSPTAGLATQGRLWVHDVVADPKFPSTAYALPGNGGAFQAHFGE